MPALRSIEAGDFHGWMRAERGLCAKKKGGPEAPDRPLWIEVVGELEN
jgi:hypothetical protein